MAFDLCDHKTKQIIIKFGKLIWPEEKNITVLYQKASEAIGMEVVKTTSAMANHLPTPEESAKENPQSKFSIICPKCNKKSYVLHSLCKGCKDAEGGIYKTMFKCYECHHVEKSKEPLVIWMQRLGIEFGTQSKESLGIKTVTDEGLK